MRKRTVVAVATGSAVLALGGATYALGGGGGIWDDGHVVRPGALDDGKNLLPQTRISLSKAIAAAQKAQAGALGQVDLERFHDRIVYMVDVGDQEVRVDAADGSIAAIGPRD